MEHFLILAAIIALGFFLVLRRIEKIENRLHSAEVRLTLQAENDEKHFLLRRYADLEFIPRVGDTLSLHSDEVSINAPDAVTVQKVSWSEKYIPSLTCEERIYPKEAMSVFVEIFKKDGWSVASHIRSVEEIKAEVREALPR